MQFNSSPRLNVVCRHQSLSEAINVSSSGFFCEVISRQIESPSHSSSAVTRAHSDIFHCALPGRDGDTPTVRSGDNDHDGIETIFTFLTVHCMVLSGDSQCTAWWWLTVHCMVVTGSVSGDNDRIGNINSPHRTSRSRGLTQIGMEMVLSFYWKLETKVEMFGFRFELWHLLFVCHVLILREQENKHQ